MSDWDFFWQSVRVSLKRELLMLALFLLIVVIMLPFRRKNQ